MKIRCAPLIAAMLTLSACGDAAISASTADADADPADPARSAIPAAKRPPGIMLEGEGLRLINPATGRTTPVPFDLGKVETLRALTVGMGSPPDQQRIKSDCREGPLEAATWGKGLTALFKNGKFVGWAGAVNLKTASGIGFGSTRAQLDAAYDVEVEQTSLGTEFHAEGIDGTLESEAPTAAVSDMWAGMACITR